MTWRHRAALTLLVMGGAATFLPFVNAPIALGLGVLLAFTIGNPYAGATSHWAGTLLRACVVGLGLGMSLAAVAGAAEVGLAYVVTGVLAAFTGGLLLGGFLRVERDASLLISSATSICGGSAVVAVGSAIRARGETIGAALGIVFILNAIALYAFPLIGRAAGLSQTQFAIWAAVAIHDTSSVLAAAGVYGAQALEQATVLKLVRTLWLIPLVLGAALVARRQASDSRKALGVPFPWFPVLFVLAVIVRSLAPSDVTPALDTLARTARAALPLVLFMIGSSLSMAALRTFGVRPFVQAVVLWVGVAGGVFAAVLLFAARFAAPFAASP